MTDKTQDAAAWLRDDPTFRTLDRQAQEREAADVLAQLGGDADDPLAVALAIDAALSAPAPASMGRGPGVEPCREQRNGCTAPLSATGRCMDCGAVRAAPAAVTVFTPAQQMLAEPLPLLPDEPKAFTPVQVVEPAPLSSRVSRALDSVNTGGGLLYRVKAATGWPDRELAAAVGLSRATVQAYIGGRLAENLNRDQLRQLARNLKQRLVALEAVLLDVEGRL